MIRKFADLLTSVPALAVIMFAMSAQLNAEGYVPSVEALYAPDFNLNFEHLDPLRHWTIIGDHEIKTIDSQVFYEGKQSLYLSTESSSNTYPQSTLSQTLFTEFERDFISLSGFIRYEKIEKKGTFNVFLTTYDENHQNPISKYIEYKIIDNIDWQPFKITLPISSEVSYVNIGGIIEGRGKVWLDDFTISFPKTHSSNSARF